MPALSPASLPSLGRLFSESFARLRRSLAAFALLGLLAPLGVLLSAALIAALAFAAMAGIHGGTFTSRLSDPLYLLNFFTIPENRFVGLALASLAGFLSLRWLGILWKAGTHAALEPGLGIGAALRRGNQGSLRFLVQLVLSLAAVQLGSALLLIPGLIVSVMFAFSSPAACDGAGPLGSLGRSWSLAKPLFWALFVRLLVLGLACGAILIVPVLGWVAGPALWLCATAELYRCLVPAPAAEAPGGVERRAEPREGLSPFGEADFERAGVSSPTLPPAPPSQRREDAPLGPSLPLAGEGLDTSGGDGSSMQTGGMAPKDDLTSVFERAWGLFKGCWWKLLLIMLVGLAAAGLGLAPLGGAYLAVQQWPERALWVWGGGGALAALGAGWALAWMQAAMLAQSFAPQEAPGAVLRRSLGLAFPMLWVGLLLSGIIVGGLLLGVLPGLLFGLWFSLAPMALVRDGKRGLDALAYSQALVRGRLGKSAAFLLVLLLASATLGNLPLLGSIFGMLLFTAFYEAWAAAPPALPLPGRGARAAWLLAGVLGLAWIPLALALSGRLDLAGPLQRLTQGQGQSQAIERPESAKLPPTGWSGVFLPEMPKPVAGAVDAQGGLWVLDADQPLVVHLGPDGVELSRFLGPADLMSRAKDIAVDENGAIYVACGQAVIVADEHGQRELGSNHLLRFSPAGVLEWALPGPGSAVSALACDGQGGLFALDASSGKVFRVSPDSQVLWAVDTEPGTLGNPFYGYAFGALEGKVYYANYEGQRVNILDATSGAAAGSLTLTTQPFYPISLAPLPGGGLWLINGASWGLERLDASGAQAELVPSGWSEGAGPQLSGSMDLSRAPDGRLYLTEALYRRLAYR